MNQPSCSVYLLHFVHLSSLSGFFATSHHTISPQDCEHDQLRAFWNRMRSKATRGSAAPTSTLHFGWAPVLPLSMIKCITSPVLHEHREVARALLLPSSVIGNFESLLCS